MNETAAADYLNTNHYKHFTHLDSTGKPHTKRVTQHDIKRWIGQGRLHKLSPVELDKAIIEKRIPPKRGRPSRYSDCDIRDIVTASEFMTQAAIAREFNCDQSYISRILKGNR